MKKKLLINLISKRVKSFLTAPSFLSSFLTFLYGTLGTSVALLIFVVLFFPKFSLNIPFKNISENAVIKPIVKVDTTRIIKRVVERLNQQGLRDEESIAVEARAFGKKLVNTLKQYAREKNVIILPSNLVISEESDITDEIIDELGEQTNEVIKAKERREE